MCGICGFWEPGRDDQEGMEREAARMAAALAHRGPDDHGVWCDLEAGLAQAHRRLSILDLSPGGHQPMLSRCGRYVLSYNGEIYNFRRLKAQLEAEQVAFRTTSDTEVLLEGIAHWGLDRTLRESVGMFAFALWDRQTRQLILARDRMGKKPLYYGRVGERLVWASELKALWTLPDFAEKLDHDSVALFLRHGYVMGSNTIYQGIRKLPAGHLLRIGSPQALGSPVPYWSLAQVIQGARPSVSEAQALEQLDLLLDDAVKIRMESDVPLGAFLSGGIDSSTVVAYMQANSIRKVRTFSIGFDDANYDESTEARRVAEHLGTEHTELIATPRDALEVIPTLAGVYDEPFADSSQIPTILVSRLARQSVTVALSGDGGDEVFAGYNRHLFVPRLWKLLGLLPESLRAVAAGLLRQPSVAAWDRAFQLLGPVLPRKLRVRNPGDKLHKLADVLNARDGYDFYYLLTSQWKDPLRAVPGARREAPTWLNERDGWCRWRSLQEQIVFLDSVTYLVDDILTKVDRASMSVSLEARAPLLDHRLMEMAWTLPMSLRAEKKLVKQLLERRLPRALFDRAKMGFGLPLGSWMRGSLRDWAEDLLSVESLTGLGVLDPEPIRRCWQEHLSQTRDWPWKLWNVLMLQAWLRERAGRRAATVETARRG